MPNIKVPQSPGQTEAPGPHPEGAPALRVGARRWTLAYKQTKASSESSYMAEGGRTFDRRRQECL